MSEVVDKIKKNMKISKTLKIVMGMLFLFSPFCSGNAQDASLSKVTNKNNVPEVGIWTTKAENGVFQIYSCGKNLCGRFIGMQYQGNVPPVSSKGHSQCNFEMLHGFTRNKSGKYWVGKISDPRDEKIYDAKLWLKKPDELRLRGYLGISLLGETQVWHRYHQKIGKNCHIN